MNGVVDRLGNVVTNVEKFREVICINNNNNNNNNNSNNNIFN